MIRRGRQALRHLKYWVRRSIGIEDLVIRVDELKVNQGRMLSKLNESKRSSDIREYEFKVFSQWGEDGIIQKLVGDLAIPNRTFVEFGVGDFQEANCRYLMVACNWSGYVMDSEPVQVETLRESYFYWQYQLQAVNARVTRENINELLAMSGFAHDVGLMSIDVDGVDYWLLEAIRDFRPRILILEYNAVFGADRLISVPYDPEFHRTARHYSNLYFGASLPALAHLAGTKGYSLIGTTSAGGNAFFLRNDLMNSSPFAPLLAREGFTLSRSRESRDRAGQLTYLGGAHRYEAIKGMPVVNVLTGQIEAL